MRYAQIRETDIANGEGIRTSLFVQGCTFHCKNCFNTDTWDFNGGKEWNYDVQSRFIELGSRPYIKGFTILGGEPMHPKNINTVAKLIHDIKVKCPDKTVWVYTGFKYEYLFEDCYHALVNIDVLIDGLFVEELKDMKLKFRGSSNQRIIDVQKSLSVGEITLWQPK